MVPSSWMRVLAGTYGEMMNAGTLLYVQYISELLVLQPGRNLHVPNTETGEVVGDVVALGDSSERDLVIWLGNVDWRGDVIREASVFVEVDDDQAEARLSDCLQQLLWFELTHCPSTSISGRHRTDA